MKILKKLEVVFLTILLLGMSSFARPVSADTDKGRIQFSHVLKDDLTDEQRSQIKDGNPTGTVDGDEDIILVYEKDAVTPPTSSQGNKVLPKAGSVSAPILVVLGLLLLSVTTFLLKRYKLSGLLLVLLMTSSFALPVQAAEKLLAETVVVSYDNGQAIRHTPQAITGHHYVGYIRQVKEPAKGTVLVEYVDENGTKLQADVAVLSDSPVGVAYTATKPDTIDYNGKTYKLFKTADNETGTVVAGVTKVTYVYKMVGNYEVNAVVRVDGEQPFKNLVIYYKGNPVATVSSDEYVGTFDSTTQMITGDIANGFTSGFGVQLATGAGNYLGSASIYRYQQAQGGSVSPINSGFVGEEISNRASLQDFTFEVDGQIRTASDFNSLRITRVDYHLPSPYNGYMNFPYNAIEEVSSSKEYTETTVVDSFVFNFISDGAEPILPMP